MTTHNAEIDIGQSTSSAFAALLTGQHEGRIQSQFHTCSPVLKPIHIFQKYNKVQIWKSIY